MITSLRWGRFRRRWTGRWESPLWVRVHDVLAGAALAIAVNLLAIHPFHQHPNMSIHGQALPGGVVLV